MSSSNSDSNFYSSPAMPAGPWPGRAMFAIGLVFAGWAATSPFLVLPRFRDNFSTMGLDLPWLTQAVLVGYPVLLALPVAVAAMWWLQRGRSQRGLACLAVGVGGWALSGLLLVLALQWPVMRMAWGG